MVITTIDMRVLETNTVALGIPLTLLMEAAGKSVADTISSEISPGEAGRVVVLVGKGGNGGDGLVAARYLANRGYKVEVIPAYSPSEIEHPDTLLNYRVLSRLDTVKIHKPNTLEPIREAGVIIDGLLGTGIRGELRDPIKSLVVEANNSKAQLRVAIDTPTGLNPDTGEVHGIAFRADITVTFHDVKPGLLKKPELTGRIVIANIGIPPEAWKYVGPGDVIHRVPPRPRDIYKGKAGRVLVIGGSKRYTGAPALSGLAALATGADLAFIAVPENIRDIVASYSPELITLPYRGEYLTLDAIDTIIEYAKTVRPHVAVIGPGLGDESETLETVKELVPKLLGMGIKLVIDADALKVAGDLRGVFHGNAVLTPHRGEFKRITGIGLSGNPERDASIVAKYASEFDAVILLKAPIDIISNGSSTRLNKTGNPYMSTGGTGDVLTGIVAALLAWTGDPFTSACVAAYVNGLAGDYSLKKYSGVSPMKMINLIPEIMRNPLTIHREVYGIDPVTAEKH
ncbi:MAG: NAD(P)H-hydrate dehydratase [Thermoprotei archaeon]